LPRSGLHSCNFTRAKQRVVLSANALSTLCTFTTSLCLAPCFRVLCFFCCRPCLPSCSTRGTEPSLEQVSSKDASSLSCCFPAPPLLFPKIQMANPMTVPHSVVCRQTLAKRLPLCTPPVCLATPWCLARQILRLLENEEVAAEEVEGIKDRVPVLHRSTPGEPLPLDLPAFLRRSWKLGTKELTQLACARVFRIRRSCGIAGCRLSG